MSDITTLEQDIAELRAALDAEKGRVTQLTTDLAALKTALVTTDKLADNAVTSVKIADKNVGEDELADNAVTAAKIKNGNVTNKKIANNAIGEAQLTDALQTKLNGFQRAGNYQLAGSYLKVDPHITSLKSRFVIDTSSFPVPPGEGGHSRNVLEFRHNKESGDPTIILRNASQLSIWSAVTEFVGSIHVSRVNTPSDMNLKHNIAQLESTLDRLEQVRGVTFEWNERYDPTQASKGQRQVGVLAQEVEAAFPEFATDDSPTGYKTVDYGRLVPVLIEALKELRHEKDGQIEDLRAQVKALQGSMTGSMTASAGGGPAH